MQFRYFTFMLIVMALCSPVNAEWTYTNYVPTNHLTVAIFGDSGMANPYALYYLETWTGWEYDNFSKVSASTISILRKMKEIDITQFDAVILQCGVNEIWAPFRLTNNLQQIYTYCSNAGVPVIKMTLNPWREYSSWTKGYQRSTIMVNDFIRRQNTVADTYTALDNGTGAIRTGHYWDHLHLNKKGNQVLVGVLMETMQPMMMPSIEEFIASLEVSVDRIAFSTNTNTSFSNTTELIIMSTNQSTHRDNDLNAPTE